MSIGIYKIENLINHKIYIGQSIEIERRWKKHLTATDNFAIHQALNKYGKDNFSFQIVEECEASELDSKEIYWIEYYNSIIPNGYNMIPGGSNYVGISKGKKVLQYDLKGTYLNSFNSAHQAENQTGINYSSICACARGDISHTKEFQWKYADSDKIIKPLENVKRMERTILAFDLEGNFVNEFLTMKEASEKTKTSKSLISKVCNNKGWTANGYFWCYKDNKNRLEDYLKRKKRLKGE